MTTNVGYACGYLCVLKGDDKYPFHTAFINHKYEFRSNVYIHLKTESFYNPIMLEWGCRPDGNKHIKSRFIF